MALASELKEPTSLVQPPWGPERANKDAPPHEKLKERRLNYHKMLDAQEKRKKVGDQALQTTLITPAARSPPASNSGATSLESRVHKWDAASAGNAEMEREIFKELVTSAELKRRTAREFRDSEREVYSKYAAASERQQAYAYQLQHEQARGDYVSLADEWKAAAMEKQRQQQDEKAARLREEQQAVQRLTNGMVPHRRMKRGMPVCYTDCVPEAPHTAR